MVIPVEKLAERALGALLRLIRRVLLPARLRRLRRLYAVMRRRRRERRLVMLSAVLPMLICAACYPLQRTVEKIAARAAYCRMPARAVGDGNGIFRRGRWCVRLCRLRRTRRAAEYFVLRGLSRRVQRLPARICVLRHKYAHRDVRRKSFSPFRKARLGKRPVLLLALSVRVPPPGQKLLHHNSFILSCVKEALPAKRLSRYVDLRVRGFTA